MPSSKLLSQSVSVGTELLKVPAGRLATVFYKSVPQNHLLEKSTASSDLEKGVDELQPPIVLERSRRSGRSMRDPLDRKGQYFAWKDLCLDIKVQEGQKRLLEDVDGKFNAAAGFSRLKIDHEDRLGRSRADDSFDGRIWSWKSRASSTGMMDYDVY